jgi:hypothetical protein
MALVATVGASTSNAYDTRANTNAFFQLGNHPLGEEWWTTHDSDKDSFLIQATRDIEMQRLTGTKNDTDTTAGAPDQRLHFPRTTDVDGGTEYIPLAVKEAMYIQAAFYASKGSASGATKRAQLQAQGVESWTMEGFSETYGKANTSAESILHPEALQMLLGGGFITRKGPVRVG